MCAYVIIFCAEEQTYLLYTQFPFSAYFQSLKCRLKAEGFLCIVGMLSFKNDVLILHTQTHKYVCSYVFVCIYIYIHTSTQAVCCVGSLGGAEREMIVHRIACELSPLYMETCFRAKSAL